MGGKGWDGVTTHARAHKDKHTGTSNKVTSQQGITTARSHHNKARQQGHITTTRHHNSKVQERVPRKSDLDGIICILYGAENRKNRREKANTEDIYSFKGAGIVGHPEGNQASPPRQGDPTVR